jgi:predicted TIM-barrel enzyme
VLADDGKLITCSNAAAIALTIPPNSSVAYGIGTQINIAQLGAGQVTITAGAGVTLNSAGTKLKLAAQYAVATCVKTDTNTWFVVGNLSA